jgi:hypothetical protein
MEIIFELLFEIVGQLVFEVLVEAGFHGTAKVLSNKKVRIVLGTVAAVGGGYLFGHWWGARASGPGDTDVPTSLWVSLALAAVFVTLALVRLLRGGASDGTDLDSHLVGLPWHERLARSVTPWQWPAVRLLGFALLNASIATGIAVGYTPHPLA